MTMLFDAVDAKGFRITKDGYLVAEASLARTGIQLYSARELAMDGDPNRVVRVYRPPEEVFSAEAMTSYAHRPVTVDHPTQMIDAANWKQYAKGQTGDEVVRDGEYVRVPLLLMDAEAISDFNAGKKELSIGYGTVVPYFRAWNLVDVKRYNNTEISNDASHKQGISE